MKQILINAPNIPLEEVVEKAILLATNKISNYEIENNVTLEEYQKPSAGLSLLRTDGFDYSMLGLDEKQAYEFVKKYGTEHASMCIRNMQETDSRCNKFPRFKKSDDLTVVLSDYLTREISDEVSR